MKNALAISYADLFAPLAMSLAGIRAGRGLPAYGCAWHRRNYPGFQAPKETFIAVSLLDDRGCLPQSGYIPKLGFPRSPPGL